MTSFFGELRRRNVVKVAVAYAIVGWLLIEVSTTVLPLFEAPDWIAQVFAFFVILGFPLALVLSWAYDLTPQGVVRADQVPLSEGITKVTGRKFDFVIIGLLVLAVGFMFVDNYLPESGPFAGAEIDPASLEVELDEPPSTAAEPTPTVAEEQQREVLPNSVAVLPFDNLSPDPSDAYFAAGLHDEILSQLAKLRNLSVISRTSMLRYADSDLSIPEIARELNVGTVMEGSVRYSNGRVRITTQLIDAATDEHLWSETYEREFSDIFAIESDIAMNIANALEAEFSLAEQERIEEVPTDSPAAYALYLRAITQLDDELAFEDLDRAISLDPEYAQAYGYKALRRANQMRSADIDEEEWGPVVQEVAERALMLDPNIASAQAALAGLHAANWRWAEALQAYDLVYQLNPNNTEILWAYGNFARDIGDYEKSVRLFERATELDPSVPAFQLGISYRYVRNYTAAAEIFQELNTSAPAVPTYHMQLAFTAIAGGNPDDGLRELQLTEQLWIGSMPADRIAQLALGYATLGRREDVQRLFTEFESRAEENPVGNAQWAAIYVAQRDYEQAFERLETMLSDPSGEFRFGQIKANDFGDPVLDEPEWQALRDRIGALN